MKLIKLFISGMLNFNFLLIFSQNLIPNPSFEINKCPSINDINSGKTFSLVKDWYALQPMDCNGVPPSLCNKNSPELFSYCVDTTVVDTSYFNFHYLSPTLNIWGMQAPKEGNSYVGMINYLGVNYNGNPYINREFISVKLKEKLKNKKYCISFFVSLADFSACATNRFGALFTIYKSASLDLYPTNNDYTVKHQFSNNTGTIFSMDGWTEIKGRFIPSGGEEYMHIGNFFSNNQTDTFSTFIGNIVHPWKPNASFSIKGCKNVSYYYFDDFSLYEMNDIVLSNDSLLPCSGESLPIKASGAEEYKWYDNNWELISTDSAISVSLPGTYYLVTRQCEATDIQSIRVYKQNCTNIPPGPQFQIPKIPDPEIPNIITPGGNGQNDFFVIKYLQPNSELIIYNRWGNVLFESKDYQQNWDCNRCSDGTYFYVLITPDGKQYKGTVTVVGEK